MLIVIKKFLFFNLIIVSNHALIFIVSKKTLNSIFDFNLPLIEIQINIRYSNYF